MIQKKRILSVVFFALTMLVVGVFINLNFTKTEQVYAEVNEEFTESVCYDETDFESGYELEPAESNGFVSYTKGMKEVNVLLNFVNYKDDYTNHLTESEISNIVTTFDSEVNFYFERMSQGFLTVNFDYACTIAPNSYDYYLALSNASYSLEIDIFNTGAENMLDYNGNKKDCKFETYNVMVNVFAGYSGKWNTFLWPHAFSNRSLIMMMEYKQNSSISSSTLCHEMLHVFGVGDLYAYTGTSQNFSAQLLDMMATSSKNVSTNAYFRNKIGWIDSSIYGDNKTTPIEEVLWGEDVTLNLYPNATNDYSKTIAYKFGVNEKNGEYFVIEYKIKSYQGAFDSVIYNSAVVIYRVNEEGYGNMYSNSIGMASEVLFMGNSSIDISSYDYTRSCLLVGGSTYGNTGSVGETSLVYSSAGGRANLFNGENSQIIVRVNSLSAENASITIDFNEQDKQTIDMSNTRWNYSSGVNYDGTTKTLMLINIPKNVSVTYTGTTSAIACGKYSAKVSLTYDESTYKLLNCTFDKSFTWEILPAEITVKIDDKTSKYGETTVPLSYTITKGKLYGQDKLNIRLVKSAVGVGRNVINGIDNDKNYNVTFVEGYYTVTPRIVGVRVLNQTYDIKDFTGIKQGEYELLDGFDSLLSGDNLTISLEASGLSASSPKAGKYVINAIENSENYELKVEKGTLSIYNFVDMSNVKWSYEYPIGYNASEHEVKLLNLPEGITVSYVGNNKATSAGEYSVSAVLNYDEDVVKLENNSLQTTVNWKIDRASLYINIADKTSKYGEDLEQLTYTITSGRLYSNAKITLQKDAGRNVGTYDIVASCSDNNYKVVYTTGKYTITPRVVNVELFDQSYAINEFKGINQDDYKITIGSDKVVSGDDLGIQISAIGLSNAEVGKYELVAVSDNPNYKVNVIGATLFIKESTQPTFIAFIIIASILTFTIICSISIYFVNKRRSYRWKDVD